MITKMMKMIPLAVAMMVLTGAGACAADNGALTGPIKAVYAHYLKIQSSLAKDSMTGVGENAAAIAKAVHNDASALPATVATEAEMLANTSDLKSARDAFKPLSDSLIKYLADHHVKNAYVEVYCPMAQASWLQANKKVSNPYMGQTMPDCGEIRN